MLTKTGSKKTKIVVITPIKNEAWILDVFLSATSLWADKIILSDQNSTDNSIEIAKRYSKVTVISGPNLKLFNEYEMRRGLFDEARKIKGKKILVAIDADEIFTPNVLSSAEWKTILECVPGTVIQFKWANILPSTNKYWSPDIFLPKAYMDDGSPYKAGKIHTLNIPFPKNAKIFTAKTIRIMHFQYVDWGRMESKQRWYQCWERINNPQKNPIDIYRQYHHMYQTKSTSYLDVPHSWFEQYKNRGVDVAEYRVENKFWRDKEVLDFINKYGAGFFSNLYIWNVNWVKLASTYKHSNPKKYADPRNIPQKILHFYLKYSQKVYPNIIIFYIDLFVKKIVYHT